MYRAPLDEDFDLCVPCYNTPQLSADQSSCDGGSTSSDDEGTARPKTPDINQAVMEMAAGQTECGN